SDSVGTLLHRLPGVGRAGPPRGRKLTQCEVIETITDPIVSLLYPQQCRVCAGPVETRADGVSCAECWSGARIFDGTEMRCEKCGAWFGEKAAPIPVRCHKCDEQHYDRAFAIGVYEKGLAAAILELKKTPVVPARLKKLVIGVAPSLPASDVIIP